jgi:hypothetical protein
VVALADRIRRWPAARLGVAWVNVALVAVLALRVAPRWGSGMGYVERPCRGPVECLRYPAGAAPVPDSTVVYGDYRWVSRPVGDVARWAVLGGGIVALPGALLAATVVWLRARRPPRRRPSAAGGARWGAALLGGLALPYLTDARSRYVPLGGVLRDAVGGDPRTLVLAGTLLVASPPLLQAALGALAGAARRVWGRGAR